MHVKFEEYVFQNRIFSKNIFHLNRSQMAASYYTLHIWRIGKLIIRVIVYLKWFNDLVIKGVDLRFNETNLNPAISVSVQYTLLFTKLN